MTQNTPQIHIIGAGISGLIAAQVLEQQGYAPTIIEATNRAGGRVKTDSVEGYQLDRGFQVLLTAYPYAKKYLDFEALSLQPFLPGAVIFRNGKQITIGDPLRKLSLLFPTLFAKVGNFSDKLRILRLNNALKTKSLEEIFTTPETTTQQYLEEKGFSAPMITDFFKPFYSGIFLETALATSSRMFEFVYKMFGSGYAALPKAGIEAISQQLVSRLQKTTFLFNTRVEKVEEGRIICEGDKIIESDYTVIATAPHKLLPQATSKKIAWKRCDALYFEINQRNIQPPIIGLVADKEALINNVFYHTSLAMATKGGKELLSVTVVKPHTLPLTDLIKKVEEELAHYCNIKGGRFIKHYAIEQALPQLEGLQNALQPGATQQTETIFLAGDYLLNASLNAAMVAGEQAALDIVATLKK